MTAASPRVTQAVGTIRGWFPRIDQQLFSHFLGPGSVTPRGDLVEIGVFLGKSAVLIGAFKSAEETFTVCDIFGANPSESGDRPTNARSYRRLSLDRFRRNYLAVHDEMPVLIAEPSSVIRERVQPASVRFIHIDGSHSYQDVAFDIESARLMLLPNGIVACDDYRTAHSPGVAAAVWEAVLNKGLHPVCFTRRKMYGTFGDPEPHVQRLTRWLTDSKTAGWNSVELAGVTAVRIKKDRSRRADEAELPSGLSRGHSQPSSFAPGLRDVKRKLSRMKRKPARRRGEHK